MACISRARTSPALTTERGQSTQTKPRGLGLSCGSRIMSVTHASGWEWCIPHAVHYFCCDYLSLVQKTGRSYLQVPDQVKSTLLPFVHSHHTRSPRSTSRSHPWRPPRCPLSWSPEH